MDCIGESLAVIDTLSIESHFKSILEDVLRSINVSFCSLLSTSVSSVFVSAPLSTFPFKVPSFLNVVVRDIPPAGIGDSTSLELNKYDCKRQ